MNFLKVKKYAIFFCLSFFISCGFVSAKDLTGFIHTSNDTRDKYLTSINLFDESYNRTNFMNLLYTQGSDLGFYFNDFYNLNDDYFFNSQYRYGISILTKDDLKYFNQFGHYYRETGSTNKTYYFEDYDTFITHLFTNNDSGYTKYHSVNYLDGYTFDDIDNLIVFSTRTTSDSTNYGVFYVNDGYTNLSIFPKYIFLFNSSGENIGYIDFNYNIEEYWTNGYNSNFYTSLSLHFPFDDSYPDMTSWYFYAFRLDINSSVYDKVYPEFFWLNGYDNYVSVSTNAGYTGISGWFKSLEGGSYDVDAYNMRFIYTDVFYQSGEDELNLFDYWFDVNSYAVPTDYAVLDISYYKKGYYMVPKSGCSYNDYKVYYSGASSLSIYALYFNYYKYSSDNSSLDVYKKYGVFSSKAYVNYLYDPLKDLGVSVDEYSDYAINVYQYSTKYAYLLYYNSDCYSFSPVSTSDITLQFKSGNYTLTSNDLQSNYNNDTVNGSNYIGGSTLPSQGSSNSNVSDSTIIQVNGSDVEVNNIVNNIPEYVSSIYNSITSLVGIVTIFLSGLPPLIYGFLMTIFVIGCIVLIIKLIK